MLKTTNGTNLIGSLFAFDFGKSQLNRAAVRNSMSAHNLDEKELPELTSRTDFRRAISQYFRENKGDTSLTFVSSDKAFIYFQINRKLIQSNAIVDAGSNESVWIKEKQIDPQIKVVYDIQQNRIIVNDDFADAEVVKSKLYELLDSKSELYNKSEVSSALIRNLIKFGNAIPVIRGQKVFFIPSQFEHILDEVEATVKEIDDTAYISRWEAPNEPRVVESVTNSVVEKMQGFNDGYKKQIEAFIAESKQMSEGTVKKKMQEIANNVKFLESYRVILDSETDTLLKNLDATKQMLQTFNLTGEVVNPYKQIFDKIKAKNLSPEEESEELKDWIPDEYLDDLISSCAD